MTTTVGQKKEKRKAKVVWVGDIGIIIALRHFLSRRVHHYKYNYYYHYSILFPKFTCRGRLNLVFSFQFPPPSAPRLRPAAALQSTLGQQPARCLANQSMILVRILSVESGGSDIGARLIGVDRNFARTSILRSVLLLSRPLERPALSDRT